MVRRAPAPLFVKGSPSAVRLDLVAAVRNQYPDRLVASAVDRFITSQRRNDMAVVASPGRNQFIVGANDPANIDAFRAIGLPAILDNFQPGVIEDTVYVDYGTPDLNKGAGGNVVYGSRARPLNVVAVKADSMASAWPLVHELTHYVNRTRYGRQNTRGDKDEVLAELETLARLPVAEIQRYATTFLEKGAIDGYYNRLKDPVAGIVHDRVLLTGSLEGRIRGPAARDRALAVLADSALATVMLPSGSRRSGPGSMLDLLSDRMVYPTQRGKAAPFLAKAQRSCACKEKNRARRNT